MRLAIAGLTLTALLALISSGATAQTQAPEARQVYLVEVLVFRAFGSAMGTEEDWELAPGTPPATDVDGLLDEDALTTAEAEQPVEPESAETPYFGDLPEPMLMEPASPFTAVDNDSVPLKNAWQRLSRREDYAPVVSYGWLQEPWSQGVASEFVVDEPDAGLSGTVKVYSRRFPHMDVNLTLDGAGPGGPRYRLQQTSKMRLGDLFYFDHPKFGVIARITETDAPRASVDDPETLGIE